tara:strand:- start:701 stop:961 length:261 start_codon:yes stop_codon:yes gene_type:complete
MILNREHLHTYYGMDEYQNRLAFVYKTTTDEGFRFEVDLYDANQGEPTTGLPPEKLYKTLDMSGHSEQYAEDAAENWVLGIIERED